MNEAVPLLVFVPRNKDNIRIIDLLVFKYSEICTTHLSTPFHQENRSKEIGDRTGGLITENKIVIEKVY